MTPKLVKLCLNWLILVDFTVEMGTPKQKFSSFQKCEKQRFKKSSAYFHKFFTLQFLQFSIFIFPFLKFHIFPPPPPLRFSPIRSVKQFSGEKDLEILCPHSTPACYANAWLSMKWDVFLGVNLILLTSKSIPWRSNTMHLFSVLTM